MKKDKEREKKAREMLDDWLISNMPHSKYISKNIQGDLFSGFNTKPIVTLN